MSIDEVEHYSKHLCDLTVGNQKNYGVIHEAVKVSFESV